MNDTERVIAALRRRANVLEGKAEGKLEDGDATMTGAFYGQVSAEFRALADEAEKPVASGGIISAGPGDSVPVPLQADYVLSAKAVDLLGGAIPSPVTSAGPVLTVYVSLGNSDDKLTQQEWNRFWTATHRAVFAYADQVHGDWTSAASAPYQNACLCFEIPAPAAATLRCELAKIAGEFGQDSIAWAEAVTEFLAPVTG